MKTILPTITLLFATVFLSAQSYNTTLGLRMGTDWGLTVQQRILKRITIEGIIQSSARRDEAVISLLLEKHMPVLTRRFNIYYGAGLHKGWIEQPLRAEDAIPNPFGLSLIAGGEMTLLRLNLSYDIKPVINFTGGTSSMYFQSGISIRYVLNKKKKQAWEKNKRRRKNGKKGKKLNQNRSWRFWES